jgi:hypothetical protein
MVIKWEERFGKMTYGKPFFTGFNNQDATEHVAVASKIFGTY